MDTRPRPGRGGPGAAGRGRRPRRRVVVHYIGRLRTNRRGAFVFRLRAGPARPGDAERGIAAGARPSFHQRTRHGSVTRAPRYRVTVTEGAAGAR